MPVNKKWLKWQISCHIYILPQFLKNFEEKANEQIKNKSPKTCMHIHVHHIVWKDTFKLLMVVISDRWN